MAEAELADDRHRAEARGGEEGVEQVQRLETHLPSTERQQGRSQHDDAGAGDHRQRDVLTEHKDRQTTRDKRIEVDNRGGHRCPDFFDADETEQSASGRANDPRQHKQGNGTGSIGVSRFQHQDGAPKSHHAHDDVDPEPDIEIPVS